jgi:hypothetical protein
VERIIIIEALPPGKTMWPYQDLAPGKAFSHLLVVIEK